MAKANYDDQIEKEALVTRALVLKPKIDGIIATSLGWTLPKANGTFELLVSFPGLEAILATEASDPEPTPESVAVVAPESGLDDSENEEQEETKTEDQPEEKSTEKVETQVAVEKKKGGRPKKVV